MWQSVPVRDSRYQRQSSATKSRKKTVAASPTESLETPLQASAPSINEVNTVVKRVKRVAHELGSESWVKRSLQLADDAVRNAMEIRCATEVSNSGASEGTLPFTLTLFALGVGSMSSDVGSSSSVLQGGFLLCLLKYLKERYCRAQHPPTASLTDSSVTSPAANTRVNISATTVFVSSISVKYFDPVLTPIDTAVCDKLGFSVTEENTIGGYAVTSSRDIILAFMPHCSAPLYHNLYAANWDPYTHDAATDDQGQPVRLSRLSQIVIVGNNLAQYSDEGKRTYAFQLLLPLMSTSELFQESSRSRKHDGCVAGYSFSEVERAFSDLSLMWWKASEVSPCCAAGEDGKIDKVTLLTCGSGPHSSKLTKPPLLRFGADTIH